MNCLKKERFIFNIDNMLTFNNSRQKSKVYKNVCLT